MRTNSVQSSLLETMPMHNELTRVKTKTKKRCQTLFGRPKHDSNIGNEICKASMGLLICTGAAIGLEGFFFLVGGIIHNGGLSGFVKGWITAFTGI